MHVPTSAAHSPAISRLFHLPGCPPAYSLSPHHVACAQECNKARGLLAGVQGAFPEVAQLVRTVQLSHKILFKKGAFIAELAQTGPSLSCPYTSGVP